MRVKQVAFHFKSSSKSVSDINKTPTPVPNLTLGLPSGFLPVAGLGVGASALVFVFIAKNSLGDKDKTK